MDVDDLSDRLEDLEAEEPDEELEIILEDTVVSSEWVPEADEERPETGVERTRCYFNDSSEWVSETVVESEPLDPDEYDEWDVS